MSRGARGKERGQREKGEYKIFNFLKVIFNSCLFLIISILVFQTTEVLFDLNNYSVLYCRKGILTLMAMS